jgi:hypothetical protein
MQFWIIWSESELSTLMERPVDVKLLPYSLKRNSFGIHIELSQFSFPRGQIGHLFLFLVDMTIIHEDSQLFSIFMILFCSVFSE